MKTSEVASVPKAWPSLREIHEKLSWLDALRPDFHAQPLEPWLAEWKRIHESLSNHYRDMSFVLELPEKWKQANEELKSLWFGPLSAFAEQQGHLTAAEEGTAPFFADLPWLSAIPKECFPAQLENVQTIVRDLAMEVSRPRIRSLTILDLPEEIIREIFGYFGPEFGSQPRDLEGHLHVGDDFGYRDIQRIRLACRRFHDASSHLLLQCVIVELDPRSLERLHKISNHSLISKGIDTIAVDLKYYSENLASSIGLFTQRATEQLEEQVDDFLDSRQLKLIPFSPRPIAASDRRVYDLVDRKARKIAQEWSDFHSQVSYGRGFAFDSQALDGQEKRLEKVVRKAMVTASSVAGLLAAHKVYKERYWAQQELITGGTFVQAISSALAKMPCAVRLHMGDSFWTPSRCSFPYKPFPMAVNDPQFLAEAAVTRPSTWLDALQNGARDLPRAVFIDTLVAAFGSRHKIRELLIGMTVDPAVHIPATQAQLDMLKQNTEEIVVFDLTCRTSRLPPEEKELWVSDGSTQPTTIESVAFACAGFKRVRELALDFTVQLNSPDTYDETQARTRGARICREPFLELENMALSSVGLHLHELKTLLKHLPETCRSVMIESLWLFSGTWREALDLLRDHHDKGTWITLHGRCRGGECEDLGKNKQFLLFPPRKLNGTKSVVGRADAYIRREGAHQAVNPFSDLDALDTPQVHFEGSAYFLPYGFQGADPEDLPTYSDRSVSESTESDSKSDSEW